MQRRILVLSLALPIVCAACGAAPVLYHQDYALGASDLTIYGLDFTRCDFWDSHFRPSDVIETDLGKWNMDASGILGRYMGEFHPTVDVSLSDERNGTVAAEQFARLPPTGWPEVNTVDELRSEIAPYLASGRKGLGLVVFVDRMNKARTIVFVHYALFRQEDGEILLHGRDKAGLARGSLNRVYRVPLEKIATRVAKAVTRSAGTETVR